MKAFVIGAGLAGCEAAWQLANRGVFVTLYERKPLSYSPAHHYQGFAELVCSNSLKAKRIESASGMLKREMRFFRSLILESAEQTCVPAGGALAVDRYQFSDYITDRIKKHPNIKVVYKELKEIPEGEGIIATGPLTSEGLSQIISQKIGKDVLYFYDAAAPIVDGESIDFNNAFFAARYDRGTPDYVNCPMNEEEYLRFYHALITGETANLHSFDRMSVYEGCMPIEILAKRGKDAMRFGPLRPIGIRHPMTGEKYYAVLQLRKENTPGTMYNLVGFQTNLKFSEQKRIFSMVPALREAEFYRYGVMHRNTFIDSSQLLDDFLRLKSDLHIRFAGQITGVEGYMESAACGIYAGICLARQLMGKTLMPLPKTTMLGALICYITNPLLKELQPMGVNMGLLPPLDFKIKNKQQRYEKLSNRGYHDLKEWGEENDENYC